MCLIPSWTSLWKITHDKVPSRSLFCCFWICHCLPEKNILTANNTAGQRPCTRCICLLSLQSAVTLTRWTDKPQSCRRTWQSEHHVCAPFVSLLHEETKHGFNNASFQLCAHDWLLKLFSRCRPDLTLHTFEHQTCFSQGHFHTVGLNYDLSRQVTDQFPQIYVVCDLKRQSQPSFYLMCQKMC